MRRLAGALAFVVLGALCACDHPCRDGTVLVRFTFDQDLSSAERIEYWVGDNLPRSQTLTAPLVSGAMLEIVLTPYQPGTTAIVHMVASRRDASGAVTPLASGVHAIPLKAECTAVDFPLGDSAIAITFDPQPFPILDGTTCVGVGFTIEQRDGDPVDLDVAFDDGTGPRRADGALVTDDGTRITRSQSVFRVASRTHLTFYWDNYFAENSGGLLELSLSASYAGLSAAAASVRLLSPPFGGFDELISGNYSFNVAIGDFNEDGRSDLLSFNQGSPDLSVRLGTAGGRYGEAIVSPISVLTSAALISDFDADGHLDAALVASTASSLVILRGDGTGTLGDIRSYRLDLPSPPSPPPPAPPEFCIPSAVVAVDLDADSRQDLLIACGNGTSRPSIAVVKGQPRNPLTGDLFAAGVGAVKYFDLPTVIPLITPRPIAIVAADFTEDGNIDAAVLSESDGRVTIFAGDGAGQLGLHSDLSVGNLPSAIAAARVDSDSHVDLVVTDRAPRRISTFTGNGNGDFSLSTTSAIACVEPRGLTLADLDRDGTLDAVSACAGSARVSASFGLGDGTFENEVLMPVGMTPLGIAVGDLDGDLDDDIVAANADSKGLTTIRQLTPRVFSPDGLFATGDQDDLIWTLVSGDFDGDAIPDLVVGSSTGTDGKLRLLRGANDGSVASATSVPMFGQPFFLVAGDVNHDGNLDVLAGDALLPAVHIALGNGRGDFTYSYLEMLPGEGAVVAMAIADFDEDGLLDLATSSFSAGAVSVWRGGGDGTFTMMSRFTVPNITVSLAAADLDQNGHVDLVASSLTGLALTIYDGDGSGSFIRRPGSLLAGSDPRTVEIVDLNGDGWLDLAVVSRIESHVRSYLADGVGGYLPAQTTAFPGPSASNMVSANLNNDEFRDLVVIKANPLSETDGTPASGEVLGLISTGTGKFDVQRISIHRPPGGLIGAIAALDLNQDGRDDIASVGRAYLPELALTGDPTIYQSYVSVMINRHLPGCPAK